jgi:pantoate--beta-alanine ligase
VLVSLFVNPAQFGPSEDLAAYPRDPERDAAIAAAAGAEVLFMPEPRGMYEADHATWVETPALARTLCGLSRPEHFRGVCTVVLKLLLLSQAQLAFFGEKDWQQLAVIRRMVRDLHVPVEIRGCPTVRDADGLALSSRNAYLGPEERAQAPHIQAGLRQARELARQGERSAKLLCAAAREHWARCLPLGREEYLALVHPHSLEHMDAIGEAALMACAVRLGEARLIDNILLP